MFSDQAVRADGSLMTSCLVQTSLPPILQRRRLKSKDVEKLIRVAASLGLFLHIIQDSLPEASVLVWGSVPQTARQQVIS